MPNSNTNSNNSPIAVFDSGIGGLTVAKALLKHLPNENILYFGDTAHFPYGEKSADSIKYYSIRIADFLLEQKAKCIVIACNSASANAFEAVKKYVKNRVPVFNVIDPVVNTVVKNNYTKIGVIATKATIKSDAYSKKIKQLKPSIDVGSLATPLLAPMIEEGFFNNKISSTVIHSYLSKPKLKKIEALILACTHYPLIHKEIETFYNNKVQILDSADIVALAVKKELSQKKLLNKANKNAHHFFVSDYTKSFENTSKLFFSQKIKLEKQNIWENE
jgi:glutamate racemase